MTNEADLLRLRALLAAAPRPPDGSIPPGAATDVLREFEHRCGLVLSREHEALLRLSNGPCVGPGGIFGLGTSLEYLDIEGLCQRHPRWLELGWVPVAGDGCGNYYVAVPCEAAHPVVFVDTMEDPEAPAYVVASDVLKFVLALLEKETGAVGWPFDPEVVLRADPDLARFADQLPLPWTV